MRKYFPRLTQSSVVIETGGGQSFECPMLPVSKLGDLNECSVLLSTAATAEDFISVKAKMIALIKTVMPEQYQLNLDRLGLDVLAELLAYLAYGDDSQNEDDAKKKPVQPAV